MAMKIILSKNTKKTIASIAISFKAICKKPTDCDCMICITTELLYISSMFATTSQALNFK